MTTMNDSFFEQIQTCAEYLKIEQYTDDIAAFFKDHQTIAALHKENQGNSLYHAHYMVNSVNAKNGKLYHSGKSELKQLAMHVHEVTGNYCRGYMKKPDEK